MAEINTAVGDQIKHLREKANWSQRELAKKVSIDHAVLSRIEAGTRPLRESELIAIADIFNVTTDYVLARENKAAYKEYVSDYAGLSDSEKKDIRDYIGYKKYLKNKYKNTKKP